MAEYLPLRIIGGMFGLESAIPLGRSEREPFFLAGRSVNLATARSAFSVLNRFLKPKTVWLPSYLCGVVLSAFPTTQTRIRFYAIDFRLRVAEDTWLSEIAADDLVVFIDYFGFNQWEEYGVEARKRGALVVEDASHAMLNEHFSDQAHYVVFSPRKFVGVPDGGILLAQGDATLPEEELPSSPDNWWLEAFAASRLRAEFDRHGGDRRWFELYQKAESTAPMVPSRMSQLSRLLLCHCFDYEEAARRRKENYSLLASELGDLALFPQLPSGIAPLGFPITSPGRDDLQRRLFAHEIYPAVHWPLEQFVPLEFTESHRLSAQILTLPCDQRYTLEEMRHMAAVVRKERLL